MSKQQYVEAIEKALVGHVSPQELSDTVNYYRDYIEMEIRKGKSEQEVLKELGNPRLLAKTIIMASEHRVEQETVDASEKQESGWNIPLPIVILILVLALLLIFGALISILRVILPVAIPVLCVVFVISILTKKNQKR